MLFIYRNTPPSEDCPSYDVTMTDCDNFHFVDVKKEPDLEIEEQQLEDVQQYHLELTEMDILEQERTLSEVDRTKSDQTRVTPTKPKETSTSILLKVIFI